MVGEQEEGSVVAGRKVHQEVLGATVEEEVEVRVNVVVDKSVCVSR